MQLNELKRKTPNKGSKRVGRGRGSGKGKTAGRGTKGQKARSGHRIRPDVREKLKKLPKLRGYKQGPIAQKPAVINISSLEAVFAAGDTVSPATLRERGLISARKGVVSPSVKILGAGELSKKLIIVGCTASGSAKAAIEKAGGSFTN